MRNLGMNEIRKEYLDFFEKEKGHTRLKSFPLIPQDDKSLLLINAGMAPLKKYFTGEKKMPNNRATSSQRCVRTGDIERVGKTERHGTFFEMLGNFSFGNYFKKEAISRAYEFLTEKLEISKDLLWVSIFEDDDEAYEIWRSMGIDDSKIMRFGKEDNFRELEVGPCGPDSEIFVDRGPDHAIDENDNKPGNDDSDRFLEVWNLVFTQFNKDEKGNYTRLSHPNIDTGMGLERIAMILQGKDNIFEIDVMQGIIKRIEELSGKKYKENNKDDISIRVIADHSKAITFLVSDGVLPSNEKRGYVLRKLIRRAYRHGKLLGIEGEFLNKVIDAVIDNYSEEYTELLENRERIQKIVAEEEEKFQHTIDQGLDLLDDEIEKLQKEGKDELSGDSAFKLYDTYGFPLDLVKEILSEKGLKVDEQGFNKNMEVQKEMARNAREKAAGRSLDNINIEGLPKTDFQGYDNLKVDGRALAIYRDGEKVTSLFEGDKGIVITDKTSFYAEGGGEVADTGFGYNEACKLKVLDCQKKKDIYFHYVEVEEGELKKDSVLTLEVDRQRRLNITRNHSATHLLDQALRDLLGDGVHQAGSFVDDKKLRFDFTFARALEDSELKSLEATVNEKIREQLDVTKVYKSYDEAVEEGAIGLFEDKYSDVVRVVSIGDYSKELCGGCHVNNSSEILIFKIKSESSVSSGVRRIEAITGKEVYDLLLEEEERFNKMANLLSTKPNQIENRLTSLIKELEASKEEIKKLKTSENKDIFADLKSSVKELNGIHVLTYKFDGEDKDDLKAFEDRLKDLYNDIIIAFALVNDGRLSFTVSVSDELTDRYNAGNLVREVAKVTGGKGGGRKNFAQAGGKDISKVDQALERVYELI